MGWNPFCKKTGRFHYTMLNKKRAVLIKRQVWTDLYLVGTLVGVGVGQCEQAFVQISGRLSILLAAHGLFILNICRALCKIFPNLSIRFCKRSLVEHWPWLQHLKWKSKEQKSFWMCHIVKPARNNHISCGGQEVEVILFAYFTNTCTATMLINGKWLHIVSIWKGVGENLPAQESTFCNDKVVPVKKTVHSLSLIRKVDLLDVNGAKMAASTQSKRFKERINLIFS